MLRTQYFHEIAVLVVPFQQIDSIHGVETGCWNEHHCSFLIKQLEGTG
jgi:hypothetical protein